MLFVMGGARFCETFVTAGQRYGYTKALDLFEGRGMGEGYEADYIVNLLKILKQTA